MSHRATLLVLLLLAAAPAATAGVELTPTLGVRFGGSVEWDGGDSDLGGSPSFGVTLDLPLAPQKWIAVFWSHQRVGFDTAKGELLEDGGEFELDIDYFHAGGVYRPGTGKKTQPFVMFTGGVTWVRPGPSDFEDEIGLSLMAGGGAKFVLSPRTGLRVEGRGYLNFTDASLSGTCGGAGCSVRFASEGLLQFEALAGVTFSF
jgi:hypothetical protein